MTEAEADYYAEQEALYRTFQDENFISNVLSGIIKPALNTIGFGGGNKTIGKLKVHDFGLGDIVIKYTQVPGALISRAIEFSPVGYVKALHNMYQMFKSRHELADVYGSTSPMRSAPNSSSRRTPPSEKPRWPLAARLPA